MYSALIDDKVDELVPKEYKRMYKELMSMRLYTNEMKSWAPKSCALQA
jgi:hypothetical protein